MKKFMEWLSVEAKGLGIVLGYVIFAALAVVSLDYAVNAALVNWGFADPRPLAKPDEHPFRYYNALMFTSMFVWSPIKEEMIFRVIPLFAIISFVSRSPWFVFGIMSVSAALFGAVHPYGLSGKVEVAIGGFFFGLVFLKCGGLNQAFVKASVCAMAAHGLTNLLLVLDRWWDYLESTI